MNKTENKDSGILVIENNQKIKDFIKEKSNSMYNLIKDDTESSFVLIHKFLRHSDLTTRGKRNGPQEPIEKNYLYYLSNEEMKEMQKCGTKFEDAKQSNIAVSSKFYDMFDIKYRENRKLNELMNIYLVSDSLEYFDINYTKTVFEKLNKEVKWNYDDLKIDLTSEFIPIQLSTAAHGIGIADDTIFHKLRCSMFRTDIIMFLFKIDKEGKKTLYIMLEKNPKFFSIIGLANPIWTKYANKKIEIERKELSKKENATSDFEEVKTRRQQNKWRNMLAEEMMNYTLKDGEVFCPFTNIEANFYEIGTLFRASHIKPYNKSDLQEAFDINNGILLCANADALFDKHYISVNENKELVFSFLLAKNELLKSKLLLNQPIFKVIFNESRMKYMKEHYNQFLKLEEERKTTNFAEEQFDVLKEESEEYIR